MMTESQALETLTREDPEAAGDARAALAWLTGDEGVETISLLRLQEFLWYALPVKWPMSTAGRVGVAKALGRLFLLAGLDRYAGVCSSAGTERIIMAYGGSEGLGLTVIVGTEWMAHQGSVGRPFRGAEAKILDDQMQEQPPGTIGHIFMKPPEGT